MNNDYRALTDCEIASLTAQNCRCDDWSKVLVKTGFTTDYIHHTIFSGDIRLGLMEKCFNLA
ncbi:MAG: DUF4954 family protein, partial [Rikenellaceae bacterium]